MTPVPKLPDSHGFSFTELMVVSVLAAGIGIGLTQYFGKNVRVTQQVVHQSKSMRDAQRTRATFERDIENSGFDPWAFAAEPCKFNGTIRDVSVMPCPLYPVEATDSTSLHLWGDFNSNNKLNPYNKMQPERVVYEYDAAAKHVNRNGKPFLTQVQSFKVDYFDANNAPTSTPNDVRKVRVTWTLGIGSKVKRQELTARLQRN